MVHHYQHSLPLAITLLAHHTHHDIIMTMYMALTLTQIKNPQKKVARRIHCTFTVVLFDVCRRTHSTAKSKSEV